MSLVSTGADAQQAASLELTVIEAEDSRPLPNAQVLVTGRPAGVTDAAGYLRLTGLRASTVQLEVRLIGYRTLSLEVGVPLDQPLYLTLPLELSPVILDGVRAEVGAGPRGRQLTQFYERVRTGTGEYITREEIERRRPRDLTELMRLVPGLRLIPAAGGDRIAVESKTSAVGDLLDPDSPECAIQYFLDGTPIRPIHGGVLGAEVSLAEIEGIEIYRRGSTVPAVYHRMKNNCGVILIWKKERI